MYSVYYTLPCGHGAVDPPHHRAVGAAGKIYSGSHIVLFGALAMALKMIN